MPLALHFFPRGGSLDQRQAALDQVALNAAFVPDEATSAGEGGAWIHRVVELKDLSEDEAPADLSLSRKDLPEVMAALHQADEVHVHGIGIELALNAIPYIKPGALANTPLILRGPSAAPPILRRASIARLDTWPGPIYYDDAALCTLAPESEQDYAKYQALPVVNLWHEHLQQNPTLGLPFAQRSESAGTCVYKVSIALSRELPPSFCDTLVERWSLEGRDQRPLLQQGDCRVEVAEWWPEIQCSSPKRRKLRRGAALVVAKGWDDRVILEAALQGLAVVVLGADQAAFCAMRDFWRKSGLETEALEIGGEEEAMIQALFSALEGYAKQWIQGKALSAAKIDRAAWEQALSVHHGTCQGQAV